jgi:hydrogenase nickel incorporation protein HypA/HybF
MHELSLATALAEQALEIALQNNINKVSTIKIAVGEISGVQPEALLFCFPEVCKGSALEQTDLKIEMIPALIHCSQCSSDSIPEDKWILMCKNCDSMDVKLMTGKEFRIIEISGGSDV